jgi:hypothetical protein
MTTGTRRLLLCRCVHMLVFTLVLASCATLGPERVVINGRADAAFTLTVTRGLFLTKVRLGAREAGPFLIDTGATHLYLDVELAKALRLWFWSASQHPETKQTLRYGTVTSLEVGPLTLQNTPVVVMDFASVTGAFGARLAGLLGYPLFAKAVIEVNYPQQSIACFDPTQYQLPRGAWLPLTVKDRRPFLTARFEGDHEGLFMLDTGSTVTVDFLPDFVQQHTLLDHRAVHTAYHRRVSGNYKKAMGTLAWFEVAGHRFEQPTVGFRLPNTPDGLPKGVAGIIGQGLLREFIVVFNYPESKIALVRP